MAATRQSNRAAKPTAEYNEYKCCLPLELRGGAPPAFQFGSDTKKIPGLGQKRVIMRKKRMPSAGGCGTTMYVRLHRIAHL
jgi:hypothetical protein